MTDRPPYWPLYIGIGLLVLVQVSHVVVKWVNADLEDPRHPHMQYYSATAWADCGSMMKDAQNHGFQYWTCNRPK